MVLEYLPTLTPKVISKNPNVGKYSSTMDSLGMLNMYRYDVNY